MDKVAEREHELFPTPGLMTEISVFSWPGTLPRCGTVFVLDGAHASDVSQILDAQNVAIRLVIIARNQPDFQFLPSNIRSHTPTTISSCRAALRKLQTFLAKTFTILLAPKKLGLYARRMCILVSGFSEPNRERPLERQMSQCHRLHSVCCCPE